MKKYTFQYRNCIGEYCYQCFEATCDTDARFTARSLTRDIISALGCAPSLFDFYGNYIEL